MLIKTIFSTLLLLAGGLLAAGAARAQLVLRAGGQLARFSTGQLSYVASLPSPDATAGASADVGLGYELGLGYQLPLGGRWTLVPEVQFSNEHVRVHYEDHRAASQVQTRDYGQRQAYLNVPLLLRAGFGRFYAEVGPQASALLHARQVGTSAVSGYNPQAGELDQDATDSFYRFDAGGCLGVGMRLREGLGLNVRAYQGLLVLNHDYVAGTTLYPPLHYNEEFRQTLQVALTYQLTGRGTPPAR